MNIALADRNLHEKLTDDFLDTLAEVARQVGWSAGDYSETIAFVQEVFTMRGREISREDLEPYEY